MKKKLLCLIDITLVVTLSSMLFTGCFNSKQNKIVSTVSPNSKVADSKAMALNILNSTIKLSVDDAFTNAEMEEGKSGYKWDDASYYQFTIMDKTSGDLGDISSVYLVKKNTRDVYVLDFKKDPSGNVLKKYQP